MAPGGLPPVRCVRAAAAGHLQVSGSLLGVSTLGCCPPAPCTEVGLTQHAHPTVLESQAASLRSTLSRNRKRALAVWYSFFISPIPIPHIGHLLLPNPTCHRNSPPGKDLQFEASPPSKGLKPRCSTIGSPQRHLNPSIRDGLGTWEPPFKKVLRDWSTWPQRGTGSLLQAHQLTPEPSHQDGNQSCPGTPSWARGPHRPLLPSPP